MKLLPLGYCGFHLYVVSAFRRTVTVRLKPDTTYEMRLVLDSFLTSPDNRAQSLYLILS